MILHRLTENLRVQNWTAITIEFVLVIAGVFLGITAANWNEQRQARDETELLLSQLLPELNQFETFLGTLENYYGVTGRYADTAFAAWNNDPAVSDRDFVIAAYQASQVTAAGNNTNVWSEIFGAGNLRNIEDVDLRQGIARIMTFDYDVIELSAVATPYRQEVRTVIPHPIQDSIRRECGDRSSPDNPGQFTLPERCEPTLDDEMVAAAAAALRARPDLASELRWHRAAVANQLLNVNTLRTFVGDVVGRLKR
jgi:hypothetical protein